VKAALTQSREILEKEDIKKSVGYKEDCPARSSSTFLFLFSSHHQHTFPPSRPHLPKTSTSNTFLTYLSAFVAMVLCHVCEECALRDPTSFGHLVRDPVANNGARCNGCPLYFCYRHLYLNHDGAMCQRAKQFFMHDEPITTTHALIAHWLACVPLRGDNGKPPD
jgi:hypothetical protein